ncbi:MAG: 50S ribosomal protein L10 [Candidatus Caldatribacterium sp.]|nr:50S ribosomal protein L10 [Candidatus Caldatribacterium sp.]
MERSEKEKIIQELLERLRRSQAVFVVGYHGMDVPTMEELRRSLKKIEGELKVAKNTLMCLALTRAGFSTADHLLKGQNAFIFSYRDVVQVAKALADFAKKFPQLEMKGGFLGVKLLTASDIQRLAELPSREELLARVVGGIAAPLVGLLGVLQGVMRNFVWVLKAIEEKKRSEKEA